LVPLARFGLTAADAIRRFRLTTYLENSRIDDMNEVQAAHFSTALFYDLAFHS